MNLNSFLNPNVRNELSLKTFRFGSFLGNSKAAFANNVIISIESGKARRSPRCVV